VFAENLALKVRFWPKGTPHTPKKSPRVYFLLTLDKMLMLQIVDPVRFPQEYWDEYNG
jgi:hypothetical protein